MLVVAINGMYQIPSDCHWPSLAHTTHKFVTFWHCLGKDDHVIQNTIKKYRNLESGVRDSSHVGTSSKKRKKGADC